LQHILLAHYTVITTTVTKSNSFQEPTVSENGDEPLAIPAMDANFLQTLIQSAQEQGLDPNAFANLMQNWQQIQMSMVRHDVF
jgi:hypothetical protein